MIPGLCSVTFRALSPEAVIDLAAGAGLGAIEWGGDVHVPPSAASDAARVGDRTRAAGMVVSSYGSYLRAGRSTVDEVSAALDAAVALGAPTVRVWAPRTVEWDDAVVGLRSLCEAAAVRGLVVATEHHVGTWTEEVPSSQALRAAVAADNLFTYWQPLPGRTLDDHVTEVLDLAPDLAHLHVFRWDDDGTRRSLATGEPVWPDVLAAAAKARGRWSGARAALIEFLVDDDPAHLAAEAAILTAWLDAVRADA